MSFRHTGCSNKSDGKDSNTTGITAPRNTENTMIHRLLIVEGCNDLLEQMVFSFQAVGWEVRTAATSAEGLTALIDAKITGSQITALIADVASPYGGGLVFIDTVRTITDVPVIIVTTIVHPAFRRHIDRYTSCVIMEKPVSFGRLAAAIGHASEQGNKAGKDSHEIDSIKGTMSNSHHQTREDAV